MTDLHPFTQAPPLLEALNPATPATPLVSTAGRRDAVLEERDLDARRGSIVVRHGKGDKRGIIGMDPWGWSQLLPWIEERRQFPNGPIFCVIEGPTAGKRSWSSHDVRRALHKLAEEAGIRKRIAPHQFRHGHAVELVREGLPALVLQRQLRHSHLGVTTTYLASIDQDEVVDAIHDRRQPLIAIADLQELSHGR